MSTTQELRPAQIAPHPSNPRRDVGDLTELTASIKNRGVLQNLVVAPVPDGFKGKAEFVLIAGHRRLAAAKAAKLKTVPATVREDLTDPADQLAAMLEENGHRADLTAVEEATAVQGLLDLGLNQSEIAARTGMKKTRISERARLAKLPAKVTEKVHTHQITIADALVVAEFDGDHELQGRVIAALDSADEYKFRWEVESGRRWLEREKAHEARRKELVTAGVTVLPEAPPEPDVDDPDDDTPQWWPVEDLLDGSDAVDEAVSKHLGVAVEDLDWGELEQWHQETCKGHAVYERNGSQGAAGWWAICTTPEAHADLLPQDGTGDGASAAPGRPVASVESDEARAAREAREKQAEDLAIAARVRRVHVAGVLDAADEDLAVDVSRRALTARLTRFNIDSDYEANQLITLGGCLGLGPTSPGDAKAAALEIAGSAGLAKLVLLDMLLDNLSAERGMEAGDYWAWSGPAGERWAGLLGGPLAYEWSEVELGMLPKTLTDDESVAS